MRRYLVLLLPLLLPCAMLTAHANPQLQLLIEQSYRSNILNTDAHKELYWRMYRDRWEIVQGNNRRFPIPDSTIVEN